MLHAWVDEWANYDEWKEAVVQLKNQGKIKSFGLSLVFPLKDIHLPRQAVATGLVDACEVVYNIFQQEPQAALFPLAQAANVGIIARCPLDEGALTGKITPESTFPEGDWRNDYFRGDRKREVQERARALQWLVHGDVRSLPDAALRFCLSHPAVTTVIAGMRQPGHVKDNAAASDKGPLPAEDLRRLKDHAWLHDYSSSRWTRSPTRFPVACKRVPSHRHISSMSGCRRSTQGTWWLWITLYRASFSDPPCLDHRWRGASSFTCALFVRLQPR